MAGSRRTRKTGEAAPAETGSPTTEGGKTAEERANDRESLENYNGDIQDGLIELVSKIKNDEPALKEESEESRQLLEAIVTYLEQQAQAALPQDKMRSELRAITSRFEKHAQCPVAERETVFRMDTNYYTNRKRILTHRQSVRKRKEESQDGRKSTGNRYTKVT